MKLKQPRAFRLIDLPVQHCERDKHDQEVDTRAEQRQGDISESGNLLPLGLEIIGCGVDRLVSHVDFGGQMLEERLSSIGCAHSTK